MSDLKFDAETWNVDPLYRRARAGDGIAARQLLAHLAARVETGAALNEQERDLLVLALGRLAHFDDAEDELNSKGKAGKRSREPRWLPTTVFMPDANSNANRGGSELTTLEKARERHAAVWEEMEAAGVTGKPTERIFKAVAGKHGLTSRSVRDSFDWYEAMLKVE